MRKLRTITISSRISEDEAAAMKNICEELNDTPARIFRNLLLAWIRKNKKKV